MIENLKEVLLNIGYNKLTEYGDYFATNAVYRGGDNPKGLVIYKDNGKFIDFPANKTGSLRDLISLTLGVDAESVDIKLTEFYATKLAEDLSDFRETHRRKLRMEKVWPASYTDKLLPHYKFYLERGISEKTLRFLRSGLCHAGSMNGRYVFPIFNKAGKIHGLSGRDLTGMRNAKWKHEGSKTKWIYPAYMHYISSDSQGKQIKVYPFFSAVKKSKEVILVESIGDMMQFKEWGRDDVLVTFGLRLSSALRSFLMTLDLDRVVIALNNDKKKPVNRGKEASIYMFVQLMSIFSLEKLAICLPSAKDFNEMSTVESYQKWLDRLNNLRYDILYKAVFEYLRSLYRHNKITKAQIASGKSLREACEKKRYV